MKHRKSRGNDELEIKRGRQGDLFSGDLRVPDRQVLGFKMTVWSENDCVARPRVGADAGARIAQSTPKFKSRFHEAIEESGRRTENVVSPDGSREERPYLDCRLPPFSRRRRRRGPSVGRRDHANCTISISFLFRFCIFLLPRYHRHSRLASPRAALARSAGQRRRNFFSFYNSDRRKRA